MRIGRASSLGLQKRFEGHRDAPAGEEQEAVGLWETLVCPLGKSSIAVVQAPEAEVRAPGKRPHLLTGAPLVLAGGLGPPPSGGPPSQHRLGTRRSCTQV